MYFVAYLVVVFHSHLHLSSFNINTNIHMKGEWRQSKVCEKGRSGIYFLQNECFYCVPPYFGLAYCVPPCFGLAYCVPFNNKTTIFGNFIYIKKIKWQYVACTCTITFAKVKFGVCLLDVLVFDIPKSMFMLLNAEMTLQKARAYRARENVRVYLTLYVTFLMKIEIKKNIWIYKNVVHNFFVDHKVQYSI